jgi:hypothetical protein
MNDGSKVCDSHSPVLEYTEANDGFDLFACQEIPLGVESLFGERPFEKAEGDKTGGTEEERDERVPGCP